ncbi:MAG: hypothetical protein R2834_19560 [Rhodothermales bacterium]
MYKPADLFLGIVDFFSVLVPGAILSYAVYAVYPSFVERIVPLDGNGAWFALLFFSFFSGHVIARLAEYIDKLWSSNTWLQKNEELWNAVFRIREDLGRATDSYAISIYQWCRSVLIVVSPEAMADINAVIASADFFRNLYVVFPFAALVSFLGSQSTLGMVFIVMAALSLLLSEMSRHTLHKRICYHVIVLHMLGRLRPDAD